MNTISKKTTYSVIPNGDKNFITTIHSKTMDSYGLSMRSPVYNTVCRPCYFLSKVSSVFCLRSIPYLIINELNARNL